MSSIIFKKIKTFLRAGKVPASSKKFLPPDRLLQLLQSRAAILIMRGETRTGRARQGGGRRPGGSGKMKIPGAGPEQTVTYARAAGGRNRTAHTCPALCAGGRYLTNRKAPSGSGRAAPALRKAPLRRCETGTGLPRTDHFLRVVPKTRFHQREGCTR